MLYMVAWVLGSIVVGWLGRKRAAGFLGFLVASLWLSPIVTVIVLILTSPNASPARASLAGRRRP
jgi:hypothetical protein